ncbi:MAG TPA: hypothetical protein VFI96_00760 [Longimicrobiaceae bacterium]|nr:hypothetical protein [Longimicrobiaceae bacterium]
MRKPLACLLGLLLLAGCHNATAPKVFSIVGSWRSDDFAPATIDMTLVETGRSPVGAGRWATNDSVFAFRVTGAHVSNDVSLVFDFDGRADIDFQGSFQDLGNDSTLLAGALYGSGFDGDSLHLFRVPEPDEDQ